MGDSEKIKNFMALQKQVEKARSQENANKILLSCSPEHSFGLKNTWVAEAAYMKSWYIYPDLLLTST